MTFRRSQIIHKGTEFIAPNIHIASVNVNFQKKTAEVMGRVLRLNQLIKETLKPGPVFAM